jgi:hypothetical protein
MTLRKLVLGAVIGAGALAATAGSASAYVACNRAGDCWHTDSRDFRPSFGITIHDNDWRLARHNHWHEHAGRGYWRNGVWITL